MTAVTVASAQIVTASLSATITNPQPAFDSSFGFAVATVGTDKIAIADSQGVPPHHTGVVYLFSTNGTLLTCITNPRPFQNAYSFFGYAMASVGSDKLLVGCPRDITGGSGGNPDGTGVVIPGAAHLFASNGILITTFSNPAPRSAYSWDGVHFGSSVAALGLDRILIGAPFEDFDEVTFQTGIAYLFATNGTLLRTFTNPTPAFGDQFGASVSALGNDKILIEAPFDDTGGTNAGLAYLFSTNGALLVTFTNPVSAQGKFLGDPVLALGDDRVIIGTSGNADAAFLFSADGALLTTFTNPAPATYENFGSSIAAIGTDRVFIGARKKTEATNTGAAFIFNTNGALLAAITNSMPMSPYQLGPALSGIGINGVLFADAADGHYPSTAQGSGCIYNLSSFDVPRLGIQQVAGGNVRVFWPLPAMNFVLEQSVPLFATNVWTQVPFPYQTNATQISVSVIPSGNSFYRLRRP